MLYIQDDHDDDANNTDDTFRCIGQVGLWFKSANHPQHATTSIDIIWSMKYFLPPAESGLVPARDSTMDLRFVASLDLGGSGVLVRVVRDLEP